MERNQYAIETSSDRITWRKRAAWRTGDKMRTGNLVNPDEMLFEAKSYRAHFKPEGDRKYVRVIIEL